ncbi:conserved hypothetical protein [Pseudomonas sp. 9AZ]|uniref:HD domain-containing protein n=1 Tax=Pseudomonas sp. 9AZ TaxID=2653168 RepID=UPI0012F221F4|nr:HD domain-containing protein [Pseudomonas sp. 9AZ]VXD00151.1 conserved hypothetical protein [Pseudomonas sp. 9AZ]
MNLALATDFVTRQLTQKLPANMIYHSAAHTLKDVLPACLRLAQHYSLTQEQNTLLATAALFHDLGYLQQYDNNEIIGAQWASQVLPEMGYNSEQIKAIAQLILVTALPQRPISLLEQIICDADLDSLWRQDFLQRSKDLCLELSYHNQYCDNKQWWLSQIKFLQGHQYFCEAEKQRRIDGKQRNIDLMHQLVAIS